MVQLCENLAVKFATNIVQGATFSNPLIGPILETLLEVLGDELGSIDQKLDKLDQKLDKLIESYYKSGYEYLNDAKSVTDSRREKWIEAALDRFRTASTVENPFMAAKSQFFVGVCYDLLEERGLALNWYENAYKSAWDLYSSLLNSSSNEVLDNLIKMSRSANRSPFLLLTYSLSIPIEFGGQAFRNHQIKQISKMLGDIYQSFMKPLADLLRVRGSSVDILEQPVPLLPPQPTSSENKFLKGIEQALRRDNEDKDRT